MSKPTCCKCGFQMLICINCSNEISQADKYCFFCGIPVHEITSIRFQNNSSRKFVLSPHHVMNKFLSEKQLKYSVAIMLLNGLLFGLLKFIETIKTTYIIESNIDREYANSFYSEKAIYKNAYYALIFGVLSIMLLWYITSELVSFAINYDLKNRGLSSFELKRNIRILIGVLNLPHIFLNITLIILIIVEKDQVYLVYLDSTGPLGAYPNTKLIESFSPVFMLVRYVLTFIIGLYTLYLFKQGLNYFNYTGDILKVFLFITTIIILYPVILAILVIL